MPTRIFIYVATSNLENYTWVMNPLTKYNTALCIINTALCIINTALCIME